MGMHTARHDQNDEIAEVRSNHGESALVGSVADVGEDEDDDKSERGADGGEGVSFCAIESEGPELDSLVTILRKFSLRNYQHLHDDRRRVGSQRTPRGKDGERRDKVWPATVMGYRLPYYLEGDLHPLCTLSFLLVILL